jgi:branched-chain amino acid transport system ATP-binding protein
MVAIARALRAGPDALFLDESTSGLSPMACDHLWERIKVLSSRGVAVVVVEQNVDLALEHSDNMLVLVSGRVAVHEDVAALTADTLADAFLGSNAH